MPAVCRVRKSFRSSLRKLTNKDENATGDEKCDSKNVPCRIWLLGMAEWGMMWFNIGCNARYGKRGRSVENSRILQKRSMQVYEHSTLRSTYDAMVLEEYLQIVLNGEKLVSLACSPDAWQELAAGYLLNEGFIHNSSDINSMIVDEEHGCIRVETGSGTRLKSPGHINTCMGRSFVHPVERIPLSADDVKFSASHLLYLIRDLDESSLTFKKTGGVHSAALGNQSRLLVRYEDIGRHNAVDKVLGYAFLNGIPLKDKCLVLSGRIASEILLKVAQNGIPLILSRSAPTVRAVELAEELGITVVGFARGQRFNLYTHSQRIMLD